MRFTQFYHPSMTKFNQLGLLELSVPATSTHLTQKNIGRLWFLSGFLYLLRLLFFLSWRLRWWTRSPFLWFWSPLDLLLTRLILTFLFITIFLLLPKPFDLISSHLFNIILNTIIMNFNRKLHLASITLTLIIFSI